MAYIYDLTDTWNASGTTFNGIKLNVTDSASASSSKLVTLQTNSTEHFSITKAGVGYISGNLGVGTTSPATKLHLLTASATAVAVRAANSVSYAELQVDSSGNSQLVAPGGVQIFNTNGSERMRINSSGNVGIGTSSPGAKLDVNGGNANTEVRFNYADNTVGRTVTLRMASTSNASYTGAGAYVQAIQGAGVDVYSLAFGTTQGSTSATERMRIDSSGNVGIGTSSPGYKLVVGGASGSTTAPTALSMDGTYASSPAWDRLKFYLFKNSTESYGLGLGVNADMQYWAGPTNDGMHVFYTRQTERMRIDSSGNVGIGTSSPGAKFQVIGSTTVGGYANVAAAFGAGVSSELYLGSLNGNNPYIGSGGAFPLSFNTNGTERMRIDSGGRVLIGTTATVGGTWSNEVKQTSSGVWPWGLNCVDRGLIVRNSSASSGFYAYFEYNGGTNNGSISWSGGTTSYNTTSDYRLKNINGPLKNSGAYIDALNPVEGSWKADGKRFIGLIAHQVQEVSQTSVVVGEKDGAEMQQMDYSAPELIANLIAEVQSLRARVAQLEGN